MFKKGIYSGRNDREIEKSVIAVGFNPIRIKNGPGDVYPSHSHPETKLLVILSGSMTVVSGGEKYLLEQGDQLIIQGNVLHSAKVGSQGCTFFWSEKPV